MAISSMEWIEKEGNSLEKFREEIKKWVGDELLKKKQWEDRGKTGDIYNAYAEDINPDLLTEDDMRMWYDIKSDGDSEKEFKEYNVKLNGELRDADDDTRKSRRVFRDILADLFQIKKIREYSNRQKNKT